MLTSALRKNDRPKFRNQVISRGGNKNVRKIKAVLFHLNLILCIGKENNEIQWNNRPKSAWLLTKFYKREPIL